MCAGKLSLLLCAPVLPLLLMAGLGAAQQAPKHKAAPPTSSKPVAVKTAEVTYSGDVAPIVRRLGCAAGRCHGGRIGNGGLSLSLFGGDPQLDCETLARGEKGRRIDAAEPAKSVLLGKLTGAAHTGKPLLAANSREYKTILAWIAQGARFSVPNQPTLVSIAVSPKDKTTARGGAVRLQVTAAFSDGSHKDVTHDVLFQATKPSIAAVSPDGTVSAKGCGQGYVVAEYLRHSAEARIAVPQKLPFDFPKVPAANRIDEICLAQQRRLGIPPSGVSSDPVFLRRIYLDTIGRLPQPEEARAFLGDKSTDKRARLADRLMARDEYADFWALKWGDLLRIKSEYPVRLWPKAVQTYYRWLHESIAADKPYDRFVTELLTSSGSAFRSGPANYYRAVTEHTPETFAETTALLFMGTRLACARCHAHPTENWSRSDILGMAAFFSGVKFKSTQEWKEEVVCLDNEATFRDAVSKQIVAPKLLDVVPDAKSPDKSSPDITTMLQGDKRKQLAQWLTSPQNPWFARALANRIWFWLMGRGLVNEPDDMRPTNPAANPQLLDYLAKYLVQHNYDMKALTRLILTSRTYQLSAVPTKWNSGDADQFSHYAEKRLSAEQMLDAICQVTGSSEPFSSIIPEPFTHLPKGFRSAQIADGSIETPFLSLFGRPPRNSPYESERCARMSLQQEMVMVSSDQIESKIGAGTRAKRLAESGKPDAEIVDELYLASLARYPSRQEKQTALGYLARDPKKRTESIQDLIWAIMNTAEFLYIR